MLTFSIETENAPYPMYLYLRLHPFYFYDIILIFLVVTSDDWLMRGNVDI